MCVRPNTWRNGGPAVSGSVWGWTLYASRPAKDTAHVPLNPVMTSASAGRQTPVLCTIPEGKLTTPGMQRMTQHSASYVMVNLEHSGRDDITAKVNSHPAMGCGVNQNQIEQGGERTNTHYDFSCTCYDRTISMEKYPQIRAQVNNSQTINGY